MWILVIFNSQEPCDNDKETYKNYYASIIVHSFVIVTSRKMKLNISFIFAFLLLIIVSVSCLPKLQEDSFEKIDNLKDLQEDTFEKTENLADQDKQPKCVGLSDYCSNDYECCKFCSTCNMCCEWSFIVVAYVCHVCSSSGWLVTHTRHFLLHSSSC